MEIVIDHNLLTNVGNIAGLPVESLRGSLTAVFGSTMSEDYSRNFTKDPDTVPRQAATGVAVSILANRISWYFDLRGPSVSYVNSPSANQ